MDVKEKERAGRNLAINLKYLRTQSGLTQAQLATRSDIPRSTVATLETGAGNPTLSVLTSLAAGLQIRIDELLSTPRAHLVHFPKDSLKEMTRAKGRVQVRKLLPEPVPGMEIDRICLQPSGKLVGVPHRPGTREYLTCEAGQITLWAAGEQVILHPGDVAAFQGDQRHSYVNQGSEQCIGFSVVTFAPIR